MNQILDAIENDLGGAFDCAWAAQTLCCSQWEFRRVFSLLAQIPISEYIRARRVAGL
ncbi:MAG: hypothetical protein PHD32_07680 [Eubacteriales bacterium]|nr:hypothetical protein [Eubacteriales bacterium]